jgi:hypothetical protein
VSTGHPASKDPYFLYGASNLGSMLALLAYPLLIEPYTTINNTSYIVLTDLGQRLISQPWIWMTGYIILLVMVAACAAPVWNPAGVRVALSSLRVREPVLQSAGVSSAAIAPGRSAPGSYLPDEPPSIQRQPVEELTMGRRLRWVLLAAIPSSLMLGVTSFITTDLSPIPLFWLIPLTLYLASFILVFARWPVVWVEKPHTVMLFAQPIAIAVMLLVGYINVIEHDYLWTSVSCYVIGFFLTTMVCHGELAKDRPSTTYLTEFYLWMSVGGMVGGMFNGLVAPILFWWGVVEFGIAIFAACLLRPELKEAGWFDNWVAALLEGSPAAAPAAPRGQPRPAPTISEAKASLSRTLDIVLPIIVLVLCGLLGLSIGKGTVRGEARMGLLIGYGIPLVLCCFFMTRPIRFGLAIAAVMLVHWFAVDLAGSRLYQSRSYFGHITIREDTAPFKKEDGSKVNLTYRQLTHGHINHGLNFMPPNSKKDWGNPDKDFSRLATTYYHREGPVGRVMEMVKFNPFPGPPNTYHSDARMPCVQIGQAVAGLGIGNLPFGNLVGLWCEPPFATIGLGTGTMASYGRPYQHVHFYEIDNQIRRLSLPEDGGETYFNYLKSAKDRHGEVQVLMGDARTRMHLPYKNYHSQKDYQEPAKSSTSVPGGGPRSFYHMMVVDAFSSDAIPAHLITLEAIEMYFEHLVEDGILCVHTSNRFVELPKVVAAVANKRNWAYYRGHDALDDHTNGHYTSEWIMVAKKPEYLNEMYNKAPEDYERRLEAHNKRAKIEAYWDNQVRTGERFLWTDDYTNLWSVIRRRDER